MGYIGDMSVDELREQLQILKSGLKYYPPEHIENLLAARDIATVKRVLENRRKYE